ncbi:Abi family protein [Facklamia sp. P12955]|uniref:Abi family protein n=1 Tax=Facklamia sp. P12955 TaxID=3421946 RepID=UPI003D16A867
MIKKGIGTIIEIFNNYGIISTKSFNKNGFEEEFPFRITSEMLIQENNEEYFCFYKNVSFILENKDGVRRQGRILELTNLKGKGEKIKKKRNIDSNKYVDKAINKMNKFNFDTTCFNEKNDNEKYEILKEYNIQPRMLNYLVNGIFLDKYILKSRLKGIDIAIDELKLNIQLIPAVDSVDKKFRLYLMEWILQFENAIKSYISRISSDKNAEEIVNNTFIKWKDKNKNNLFEKARKERLFRKDSDEFDYVNNKYAPIEDFMDQLDLSELRQFVQYWYEESKTAKIKFCSYQLELIFKSLKFFDDLSVLRNAAAHGRSILIGFMDVDYNANWDLEFDSVNDRTKIKEWELYEILEKYWIKQGVDTDVIPNIIQTIYGNKFRKAWVVLNYLYMKLISQLDSQAFKIFYAQANNFLLYPLNMQELYEEMKDVNILNLKLCHMGSTTFENITSIPAPYKEISNEAFSVWDYFIE